MLDPAASEAVKKNCILVQWMKFRRVADIARVRRRIERDLDRKSPYRPVALWAAYGRAGRTCAGTQRAHIPDRAI
jgi:hypothetical protein